MSERDVAALYVRWVAARAALARGWWLVTSLYLVVAAGVCIARAKAADA